MHELDPNYSLPLWRSVVSYFRHYRPLVQADQCLPTASRIKTAAGSGPHRPQQEKP